ncbi:hypothetical protein MJO28_001990 [Puccinia striiformis f. sp. tritici]|uniref:Uncharacterized protein n=2 Tax=Puccinia striiformis TaxID=27350 RepID=A0A2S4VX99_9BASI|nr:hypothetical protein MJO28_001990 [Puccinia striiformis f. sp. tritici]POW14143.1 hypothetical protein PSTT_03171 [Puccinia striiformis]
MTDINQSTPKFLGCLSSSQTQTLYSIALLSISLLTLSNLPNSASLLFERGSAEEEEEDLLNSRTVLELSIIFSRILAQSALFSSLVSITGTILTRRRLQIPLQLQALVNLFISSFGSVVLGTLYLSPSLLTSASHELCLFAMRSDSLSSLSRTPDDTLASPWSTHQSYSYFSSWPSTNLIGENCDERASSIVLPILILLSICNLFHLHLLYVLFSTPPQSLPHPPHPLLPTHHTPNILKFSSDLPTLPPASHEKNLILL